MNKQLPKFSAPLSEASFQKFKKALNGVHTHPTPPPPLYHRGLTIVCNFCTTQIIKKRTYRNLMITKLKKKWGDTDFAVPRQGRKWMTSWQNHVLYTSCATSFVFPFVASFFVFDALKFSLNWVFTLIAFDKKENRPLCKMADDNSNKLKLAKTKNIYRHCKEHLYFSNPVRFQHFRCYISWENVSWKLKSLQKFVWLGVCIKPPIIS